MKKRVEMNEDMMVRCEFDEEMLELVDGGSLWTSIKNGANWIADKSCELNDMFIDWINS